MFRHIHRSEFEFLGHVIKLCCADFVPFDGLSGVSSLAAHYACKRGHSCLPCLNMGFALADMGTRPASMTLECDVTLDEDGRAGFAFGGSAKDDTYTALCLDAWENLLHYEGYEISELSQYEPAAITKFDFTRADTHHVKLVCENEIVVLYIDDAKALSSRITHSIDGAHIGVFTDGCSACFSNISIKIPG